MDNENESYQEDLNKPEGEETPENDNNEPDETPEELRERLAKAEEVAKNQKVRAEKAEKENKTLKTKPQDSGEEAPKNNNISRADERALLRADIHEDDEEEVIEFCEKHKLSVKDGLAHNKLKAILKVNSDERKVADATNTGKPRRGKSEVSGELLAENFEKTGEIPESDADLDKLLEARLARK